MSRKWAAIITLGMLVLTAALAGCGGGQPAAAPEKKVLRVGTDATFAPFEFQDVKTKEYIGFDIDLAKAIGKQMGYEVQLQNSNFDGLIPALAAGNVDVIMSGMTITDARKQKVAFSTPYYQAGLTIVVPKDNTAIKGFKDLEGKRISVQIGTTSATEAKKIPNAIVREYNTSVDALLELKAGGADASIGDKPVNEYYLAQGGAAEAKIVGQPLTAEEYGVAIAKNNTELKKKVNDALAELKKNGEYDQIYQKWFGVKAK